MDNKCVDCGKTTFAMFTQTENNKEIMLCMNCEPIHNIPKDQLKECSRCGRMRKTDHWTIDRVELELCDSCVGNVFIS